MEFREGFGFRIELRAPQQVAVRIYIDARRVDAMSCFRAALRWRSARDHRYLGRLIEHELQQFCLIYE